jgi:uncharacterized protein
MKANRRCFLAAAMCGVPLLRGSALASGPVTDRLRPLALNKVKVGGLIGDRMEAVWRGNILKLNIERDFTGPFLERDYKRRIPGNFINLGALIDSLVRFSFHTGDADLLALKEKVVGAALRSQDPDGYIGFFPPEKRIREAWDIHELNYVAYGLLSDYQTFGQKKSLAAALRGADYLVNGLSGKMPGAVNDKGIHLAMIITGFDRTMLALHRETGDPRYLQVLDEVGFRTWNLEIVQGRKPPFYGHVYAYLARSLAQFDFYRMTGDAKLQSQLMKGMNFFRKQDGLLVIGTGDKIECWQSDHSSTGESNETCVTAYLIRVLDNLGRWSAEPIHGDMMERALYNALFGAISPDGRQLRYWTPLEGPREWYRHDFMCCPGNLRRIVAELPGMIYYQDSGAGGIRVNLYTSSSAEFSLPSAGKVVVEQQTDYPGSGNIAILVRPEKNGATFPIAVRIPRWCRAASLSVNGKALTVRGPGWAEINRRWRSGDQIDLKLEMPWRFQAGVQSQEGRVAIMRGPQVYCLNPARNAAIEGADLRRLVVNTDKPPTLQNDEALRKNGTACQIPAWSSEGKEGATDARLLLTEFPDPGGQAVYFQAKGKAPVTRDELLES